MSAKIIVGDPASPLAVYQGDDVKTCTCVMYSALSGEELAIDQLLPVVYSAAYVRVRFVPAGSTGLRTADGYIFTVFPADIRRTPSPTARRHGCMTATPSSASSIFPRRRAHPRRIFL